MSSRQGQKRSAIGLRAIVLAGLLLLSGSTSASFIEHSNHQVIAEPKLINIPNLLRGHPHGSHGHRHRARLLHKKTAPVVVEVPYTIWTGTFEDLKRRAPASKDDDNNNTQTDNTSTSTGDACTGIVCPKGYYCTTAGEF
ncbi:hypothetical protein EV426DRAFT_594166 [Tirmania nivea]|nr:hypothetical protein EV426DRAFT_594166 [Tirmania nivea]